MLRFLGVLADKLLDYAMKLLLAIGMLALTVVPGHRHLSAAMLHQDSLGSPPKPPVDLSYGPINYGLQMAAWFDPERVTAYCAIRSGSKLSVRYCDYLVGNFEFVSVYARRSSTDAWRRIPRRRFPFEAYLSAGPTWGNIRWLRSGKVMPPGPYGNMSAYDSRSALRHTFEVDLRSYLFPEDWTGDVECKIVQLMLNDVVNEESAGNRKLESSAFAVRLPIR